MGFEIAKAAANFGASVVLISGPTSQKVEHALIKIVPVVSADDMYKATLSEYDSADIAILSAAVSDYKPTKVSETKIKKSEDTLRIELVKTKDILASLGKIKNNQYLVGFALETDNELKNAKFKLINKNLDLIVLNSLKDKGAGFAGDTNKVTIIDKDENISKFELKSKTEVAQDILNIIINQIHA
jgi:phosphopantothenoylcysteine decarboxylase/phosphopantothenate--cysteine ligase